MRERMLVLLQEKVVDKTRSIIQLEAEKESLKSHLFLSPHNVQKKARKRANQTISLQKNQPNHLLCTTKRMTHQQESQNISWMELWIRIVLIPSLERVAQLYHIINSKGIKAVITP